MSRFTFILLAMVLIVLAVPTITRAEQTQTESQKDDVRQGEADQGEALWEIGVAGGVLYAPDYPAAAEGHVNALAVPYVIYRGDFFRLGDGSIAKGVLVENKRIEFDISFDASFEADSSDNDARMGMPDLDFLGEVGPQLTVNMGTYRGGELKFGLPVRAVFSTDLSSVGYEGYVINPVLSYTHRQITDRVGLSLDLGVRFADSGLQSYFYEVKPEYATLDRPAYEADGGYMGADVSLGFSYKVSERVDLYVGGQISYYGGAANQSSPLFKEDWTAGVASALVWSLWESEARASGGR